MSTADITYVVLLSPSPSVPSRKSAAVSPTVVQSTLMTQKYRVTSGTLFSIRRPTSPRRSVSKRVGAISVLALAMARQLGEGHLNAT